MPFTFSHPAIVIPLLKKYKFSATGLIIGSMCPDFEYFIRMKVQSDISHTLLGMLLFNLPVGFLIAILFHEIIKKPLIENLPTFFQDRLVVLKEIDWIHYLRFNCLYVIISILIGAFSHVFWDSFTHKSGYFVNQIPYLRLEIIDIPMFKIAQHSSSLLGMLLILFYFYKLPAKKTKNSKLNWNFWITVLVFTMCFIGIRYAFGLTVNQIGNVIVSLISSVILALTFTSLIFTNRETTL